MSDRLISSYDPCMQILPLSYLFKVQIYSRFTLYLDILADDVTGMKAQSSHSCHADSSVTQNGIASHDMNLKASNDVTLQDSLSQKSQETENDNIPEEVSVTLRTK